jgi:NAD(P)-dependent dehydrogenase (short-subunit alcohol dehydrogenase family)
MNVLITGATTPVVRVVVGALLAARDTGHVLAVDAEHRGSALPSDDARFTYERTDLTRERSVHDLLYGPAGRSTRSRFRRCVRPRRDSGR